MQHWTSDLGKWRDKGVDTPGIVLIKVKAKRATYWKGREEGEIELRQASHLTTVVEPALALASGGHA